MNFNYELQPGMDLKSNNLIHEKDIISIILPITNQTEKEEAIHTINSVLNQNFPNFELLLIENEINDSVKEALKKYNKLDLVIYNNR